MSISPNFRSNLNCNCKWRACAVGRVLDSAGFLVYFLGHTHGTCTVLPTCVDGATACVRISQLFFAKEKIVLNLTQPHWQG